MKSGADKVNGGGAEWLPLPVRLGLHAIDV